ncbi:unnamed protein product [Caenorhabditis auriculariae]|uniref:Pre-rRNA-processing protein TSR1 homolog n=1 Tax=Caenorhabditis auriculariae TaxID=2777116 RepID=A0A8S1HMR2_9PELO|nr:unnamed protein product [Caenorhabditis auriculariae]
MSTTGHRAGSFKKPAKIHKSWKGKRTKGEINDANRGREGVKEIVRGSRASRSISKDVRRQQSRQIRAAKMQAVFQKRRSSDAPVVVTVLSLGNGASAGEFVSKVLKSDETVVRTQGHRSIHAAVSRFKSRLCFLTPSQQMMDDVLDSVKICDILCVLWPLDGNISDWDNLLLSLVKANGIPKVVNVVPGLSMIPAKKREEMRKNIESHIANWSLNATGISLADSPTDGIQFLRSLIETKKKPLSLQTYHPYMYVEKLDVRDRTDETCTLVASGYLRGPEWNANHLVHIPGFGDFQINHIAKAQDPHPLKAGGKPMEELEKIAQPIPQKQQQLQVEIVPDDLNAEQTWPTQEELNAVEKEKRRVPKGTSSYQATWIINDEDEDDDEDDEDEEDSEEEMDGDFAPEEEMEETEEVEMEKSVFGDSESIFAGDMDDDIDMQEVEKYRRERENAQFPDEVDTPIDVPARVQFQQYRGLKSFRTSEWDVKENLPLNYARIFQIANFKRTKKQVLKHLNEDDDDAVVDSQYNGVFANVHIANVPVSIAEAFNEDSTLVLFQLLPHEQRMSVMNMVLRRHPTCTVPLTSHQKFIFYVGFRSFTAEALFSQHTSGDKFKMERFMPTDGPFVATVFAPITFPPASVLVFRLDDHGRQELVATGSVLDNNPDRVVLKRIVLSGHPFKINRRAVVVRYMFFNREDIEWFKPIELYTPSGRRGHIREPLGTHGHMKCRFDQQLNAMDSVMLNLYKRVFPTWTYTLFDKNTAKPSRIAERDSKTSTILVNRMEE